MKNVGICVLVSCVVLCSQASGQGSTTTYTISTFAGGGLPTNIQGTSASLFGPQSVTVDKTGDIFFVDRNDVLRLDARTGVLTLVAGNGTLGFSGDNGPATSAQFDYPGGIAVDSAGTLYIADPENLRIRKVANGVMTTVAGNGTQGFGGDDGPATGAQLDTPFGVAVDSAGNLYIADTNNGRIRKVATGIITTVAGNGDNGFGGDNGPATGAQLNEPNGVAVDAAGNLYIADSDNARVRKVSNGVITTIAGNGICCFSGDNGPATSAGLGSPSGVAVDSAGDLYVADGNNNNIRLLKPNTVPAVSHGGIVPVGSTVNIIQPGEWVSIYGTNLAGSTVTWNGNFPTSLGGTSVTINGKAAFLSFVSPTQIDLQAPSDTATGPVPVVVITANGTATSTVTLAQFAPSLLLLDSKHVAGIIIRTDGSGDYGVYDIIGPTGTALGYATVAAKVGDTIELFGTGFGPTNPVVPAGQAFSESAPTTNPVALRINNVSVTPSFAGLTGAGLYQINLTVPAGLDTGDVSLVATVGSAQTPSGVVISLQ